MFKSELLVTFLQRSLSRQSSVFSVVLVSLLLSTQALAAPTFSKVFSPAEIGLGSTSKLTFTITNDGTPATNLSFTDNLPAGMVLATPSGAIQNCEASLSANAGGTAIILTGGRLAPNESCTVEAYVSSSVIGTHMNVSGDLTSSDGNSGNATADLTVLGDRPGFAKFFAPNMVALGDRSTLTFLIDNSANPNFIFGGSFTDILPVGIEVANPNNAINNCATGSIDANPGSNTVSFNTQGFGVQTVTAGASCTVSVDVVATGIGGLLNVTSDFVSLSNFGQQRNSGFAVAELAVDVSTLHLIKTFVNDPVGPGDTVELNFSITNRDRRNGLSNISFSDDLDAILSGLTAVGLPANDICGNGSSLSGGSLLTFSGGSLAGGESCEFTATLQVPAGTAQGGYTNLTSTITADGGVSGNKASDTLFIDVGPVLDKTFLSNPIGGGEVVTLQFTVTNGNSAFPASDISFIDNISNFIDGAIPSDLPLNDVCGIGSTLSTIVFSIDEFGVQLTGGSLAAGDSCVFSVDIQTPVGTAGGAYTNITEPIMAVINGVNEMGSGAQASLTIVEAPELEIEYIDDPVAAGGVATLQFGLQNSESSGTIANNISFTLNLDAALSGLTATSLPINDICGVGSSLSGTSNLVFTAGSLGIGEDCTFSIPVAVPSAALPGSYLSTTSDISADVSGINTSGNGSADALTVAGLGFTKSFSHEEAIPGATVNLEFNLSNISALDATGILFTDNLASFIPGTTISTVLPLNDVCGIGSSLITAGSSFLVFQGGSLTANESCSFNVDIVIPPTAEDGGYTNISSDLQVSFSGSPVLLSPAVASLTLNSELIGLLKSFDDEALTLGGSSSVSFTVSNLSETETITNISLSDDLDNSLSGTTASGLPVTDPCGAGSSLTGSSVITLSGGTLAPGASCSFTVNIDLPASAEGVSSVTNTTSSASGTASGLAVFGSPASDSAIVVNVDFSKVFDNPSVAGDMGTLSFAIANNGDSTLDRLLFTDDLDAVLPGLVATGLPLADVCGIGSLITGSSVITLTGGVLAPGESCLIDIAIAIPANAATGNYQNITSPLNNVPHDIAPPATATMDLVVRDAAFSKSFAGIVDAGTSTTLSFNIENTGTANLDQLTFSDDLDGVLSGLLATGLPQSDVCGIGSSFTGTSTLSLINANLAPGDSCQFSVQVSVPANATAGDYQNVTSALTEGSIEVAQAATAMLTVNVPLIREANFSKSFASSVEPGNSTSLMFTINNTGTADLVSLVFSDDLNAVLTGLNATGLPLSNVCGTGSSISGSGAISLSGGNLVAGASCSFSVQINVPATASAGSYTNVTSPLSDSVGSLAAPATATLTVDAPQTGNVTICHKPNNKKGGKTLTLPSSAIPAHLNHGDTLGACANSSKQKRYEYKHRFNSGFFDYYGRWNWGLSYGSKFSHFFQEKFNLEPLKKKKKEKKNKKGKKSKSKRHGRK